MTFFDEYWWQSSRTFVLIRLNAMLGTFTWHCDPPVSWWNKIGKNRLEKSSTLQAYNLWMNHQFVGNWQWLSRNKLNDITIICDSRKPGYSLNFFEHNNNFSNAACNCTLYMCLNMKRNYMNCSGNICRYLRRNFMNRGENICRYIRSLRFHTSCKCECAPSVGMVDTNCSVIHFQKIKVKSLELLKWFWYILKKHWRNCIKLVKISLIHWAVRASQCSLGPHWALRTLNIVIFQLGPALDIERIEHWEHRTLCFSSVGLYWTLNIVLFQLEPTLNIERLLAPVSGNLQLGFGTNSANLETNQKPPSPPTSDHLFLSYTLT